MKIANYRGQQCVFDVIHHLTTINTKLGLIDTCVRGGWVFKRFNPTFAHG